MTVVPPLPNELTDRIVDHLHNDHAALFSCSHAHFRFRPSCYMHLFKNLKLDMNDRGDLRQLADALRATPALARRIQQIRWYGSWDYPTIWVVTPFSKFSTVTALHLSHMKFETFKELVDYVSSFPDLNTLSLSSVVCDRYSAHQDPQLTKDKQPRLASLTLEDMDRRMEEPLLTWLQSTPSRDALRFLRVDWMRDSDVHLTQGVLLWHKETLYELHVSLRTTADYACVIDALPLHSTHSITVLTFSIQYMDFAAVAPLAMHILSTTAIPSVQTIKLRLHYGARDRETTMTLPTVEYSERPSFTVEQWPNLRNVDVEFAQVERVSNTQSLVDCFRIAERRGVLVEVRSSRVARSL